MFHWIMLEIYKRKVKTMGIWHLYDWVSRVTASVCRQRVQRTVQCCIIQCLQWFLIMQTCNRKFRILGIWHLYDWGSRVLVSVCEQRVQRTVQCCIIVCLQRFWISELMARMQSSSSGNNNPMFLFYWMIAFSGEYSSNTFLEGYDQGSLPPSSFSVWTISSDYCALTSLYNSGDLYSYVVWTVESKYRDRLLGGSTVQDNITTDQNSVQYHRNASLRTGGSQIPWKIMI